jgi:hypothetical protein
VKPDPFPEVKWLTVTDGSRAPGDLEDRAAKYLAEQNLLLINGDFRAFTASEGCSARAIAKLRGVSEATIRRIFRSTRERSATTSADAACAAVP